MLIVRQSTARTVTVGPILDADGAAVTDAAVGDLKISKNGGAPAGLNGSATLTHRHTGHYSLALTASDTDTVGQAEVVIDDTTNAMPPKELTIIEEAVYDALYAASATGALPVSGTVTLADGGITAAKIATDAITADKIAANAIGASELAADAVTEIQSGLATASALATVDNVVDAIQAVTDNLPDSGALTSLATASALSTVDSNVDAIKAVTDVLPDAGALTSLASDAADAKAAAEAAEAYFDDMTEDDGGTPRFTENALEEAPAGTGSGASAQDVWEYATRTLTALDEDSTTLDIDSAVQTAAAAALTAYDPPTKAELDAAVAPLATSAALATVDNNVDAILEDTGTSGVVVAAGSKAGYSLAADQSSVTVGTVNALGTQAKADVNAEVDSAITDAEPIEANVKAINDVTLTGDGTSGTPWGPA